MSAKMIWANFGVADIARTTKFYTVLGFKPNGDNNSTELVSFLFGDNNFIIHFFIRDRFERDARIELSDSKQGNEIVFSLSAKSKAEVGEWVLAVEKAGGQIYAEPTDFEKGYTFGFADPDGHKFNVLYWPGM